VLPDIIKKANNPITAPVNNNTTHRISYIDFTPTIEDVEVNIQYNKNKNINVLKNPIVFIIYVIYIILFYYYIKNYIK